MAADKGTVARQRGGWSSILVLSATVLMLGLPGRAAAEVPDKTSQACQMADDATVANLMDLWAEAIKSEHPDRIARLFLPDASMEGFASPVPRTTYAAIREYYLYYFQFAPQVRFEERHVEMGCNHVISSGNYTWSLKSGASGRPTAVPARYRFVFEYTGSQWQIGEHIEELTGSEVDEIAFAVPAPQQLIAPIVTSPEGPAVAGFLKRASALRAAPAPAVRSLRALDAPSYVAAPKPQLVQPKPQPQPVAATLRERRWQLDVFQPAN